MNKQLVVIDFATFYETSAVKHYFFDIRAYTSRYIFIQEYLDRSPNLIIKC